MQGNNKIQMCVAEMIRAIEYYLNEVQFKERVRVASVSENKNDHYFCISLEEPMIGDAGCDNKVDTAR